MHNDKFYLNYSEEHVWYEVIMLRETVLNITQSEIWLHNAIHESFCIHLRNLTEFLFPGQNKKVDDVTIIEYFPQYRASQLCVISTQLKKFRLKANKEIAHLTDKRKFELKEKDWPYLELASELLTKFSEVIDQIPPEKMSNKFRIILAESLDTLNSLRVICPVSHTLGDIQASIYRSK